jgi:hypothetical protein
MSVHNGRSTIQKSYVTQSARQLISSSMKISKAKIEGLFVRYYSLCFCADDLNRRNYYFLFETEYYFIIKYYCISK